MNKPLRFPHPGANQRMRHSDDAEPTIQVEDEPLSSPIIHAEHLKRTYP